MAPTLTTTARVRLRPPKPPPRLVEPPRTTSNGHRKQAPDVVAAAKLTLATLRAGDARAARRRCLRAGFHALRVGVANERLERAATAVRRREAAAEHAAAAIARREAAAGDGPKSPPRWVKALVASEARTAAASERRGHGVALRGVGRAADAVVMACAAAAAAAGATAQADNSLLTARLAAANASRVLAETEAREATDAAAARVAAAEQALRDATDAADARVWAAEQELRVATDAANMRVAAAEKASSVAETRANASETSASEIVAVARARVQNAEKEAFETEAAAQQAVKSAKRAVAASDARAVRAEAETKKALAAMRASIPDAAVSRALAARWRCAAAVSNAKRVADHCYVGLAADAATDARDETVNEQHAHRETTERMRDAEVDAHQAREVLGAVERRSARVEKVASVVAKRLGTHAAGGVLRARLHKWHRASETSKVSEQVSLRQVAASRWLARLAGRSRPRLSRAFHCWRRQTTADVMAAARRDEAAVAAMERADDVCELIDAVRSSALRRIAERAATRQVARRHAFAEWKAVTMMDANDELADEKSRLLLLQSLWAARMGGLE